MANYKTVKRSPFMDDEEEEVDDFDFLNHPRQGRSGYMLGNADNSYRQQPQASSANTRQMQIQDEIRKIGERTADSSDRCLGMVYNSERIGIATAEELLHQREQLQNSERKIDEVNASLKTTQKHITSIKSIFGGIKSYFSKNPEQQRQRLLDENSQKPEVPSTLESVVDRVKSEQPPAASTHPAMRIRGLDDDEDQIDDLRRAPPPNNPYRSKYAEIEDRLDSNLDEMSAGLDRLKGLAQGLGTEIEDQNMMIERITDKTETGELKITQQNNQLRRILGR